MSLKKDQTHGLEAGCFTKTSKTEIDNGRIMIFDITNYYILRMTIFMWIILFCLFLLLQCCKSSYVSKSETISFPLLDVSGPWRGCHTWGFQSRNPSSSFSLFTRRFFGWTSNQYGCHRAVFFMKRAWMWTHHRSQMLCIYIYKNVVFGIGGSFLPGHYAMKMMPSIECIARFLAVRVRGLIIQATLAAVHRSDASRNVLQSHMQDVIKFIYILYTWF